MTDFTAESALDTSPHATAPGRPRLPQAAMGPDLDSDRNGVFNALVTADKDIVGLVAYAIYKQNKHDWLLAFQKAKDRMPTDEEAQSYILGESTPRRLAIYRHLAAATLDGRGPDTPDGSSASSGFVDRTVQSKSMRPTTQNRAGIAIAGIIGFVVLAAIAIWLVTHGGPSLGRP